MNLYAYGIQSEIPLTQLEIEVAAFLHNPPEGLGKVEHFWNIVTMLWGPQNKAKTFERNPWTERMAAGACENQYLGLNGCAACVAGHTRILNPITGEQPTIQELCEKGIRPTVMTMDGPTVAKVPFVKGFDQIYEVALERGGRFHATAFHRVYTSKGFVPVSSLLHGSQLFGYEPFHPESSSDSVRSIRGPDVLRSRRITANSPASCFAGFCPDGEPLLRAEETFQSSSPLRAGVQECMEYASVSLDDLGSTDLRIHPCQCACRLASSYSSRPSRPSEISLSRLLGAGTHEPGCRLSQPPCQFHSGLRAGNSFSKPVHDFSRRHSVGGGFAYPEYRVVPDVVQAIRNTGKAPFYDLHVPGPNHYFAEGAIHHNSGKTEFAAVWAIVNWMCAPSKTLVFCTSTSLKESNRRIWGRIKAFWQAAPPLPGKLVDSMYIIRTDNGTGTFSDEQGIACIAGEKKNEKEAIGKMIGAHPERLILIVDEMPEITEAVLAAALSNMAINPFFQMIGVGNFKSMFDSFGVFVRPKLGYATISAEDEEWETELGLCLRFDGMKSPNITGGKDRYLCYDSKNLATHRKNYGPDSAEFWRMCRSFPTPVGLDNALYSRADLNAGQVELKIPSGDLSWLGPRIRLSSLDPSYTNGGDRTVQWFGWWGVLMNGVWCLCLDGYKLLRDEVGVKKPRDYQIVRQFRDNCIKEGVTPSNAAFDGTAATSFGAIISEEWSPHVLKVEFGGAPSDRPVSANDPRTARDLFDRRVSELWGVGREFVRAGQIKGVLPELSRELEARHYETSKRGGNVITVVETKADMKKRLGFSPDLADAAFVMLELVRRRHGALAGGVATGRRAAVSNFFKIAKEKDRVYSELYAEADS